jgi:hypothetical protein
VFDAPGFGEGTMETDAVAVAGRAAASSAATLSKAARDLAGMIELSLGRRVNAAPASPHQSHCG